MRAVDTLHPTTAIIRYELVPKGAHILCALARLVTLHHAGDVTDGLFTVVGSGASAGEVYLTGTINTDIEFYSINIRAFRVINGDMTPRSGISTVSMIITVSDVNNNSPVILNPRSTPISLVEVRCGYQQQLG